VEYLISLLCLCTIFVPVLLGVGLTLLAERQIGRWAYLLGGLLPVIVLFILYGAYDVALRVTGCEPADSLACGQPLAAAFLFSVGFLCVTIIASALAQAAVFFFLNGRRQAQMQGYMDTGEEYGQEGMQVGEQGYMQDYTQAGSQEYYQQGTQAPQQEYIQPDPQAYTQADNQRYTRQDEEPHELPDTPQETDLQRFMRPDSQDDKESDHPATHQ
jgi:hypothetical protein